MMRRRQKSIILNDEVIAFRKSQQGIWQAFPTPFWGSYIPKEHILKEYNKGYDINHVSVLSRRDDHTQKMLSRAHLIMNLMPHVLNFTQNHSDIGLLMDSVSNFASTVPLSFLNPLKRGAQLYSPSKSL